MRRKPKVQSKTRKAKESSYKASHALLPATATCAVCGLPSASGSMEKHHPAGRRKAAFCFYILLHTDCHRRVHNYGKWSEEKGLLSTSRNSTEFTIEKAKELIAKQPFPAWYALEIFEKYQFKLSSGSSLDTTMT